MTPSQWHDDSRNRDAGHDELQIAVFDYLESKPCDEEFSLREVGFEVPFMRSNQIIAWADLAEFHRWQRDNSLFCMHLFEIKPRIYSVGAVVRQCDALQTAAESIFKGDRTPPMIKVHPVVVSDDPKLAALRHVYHALAWDGERLS